MNKILKTVLANTDFQKRNCSDKSQEIALEKLLGLAETTSIAIKAVPKLLAVSILLSWCNRFARSKRLMKSHSIKVLME